MVSLGLGRKFADMAFPEETKEKSGFKEKPVAAEEVQWNDPVAEQRNRRADHYFVEDLQKQRDWYSKRASTFKSKAETYGILIIAAGVLTTLVPSISDDRWTGVVTALLGAAVALMEGWQRIARYSERWMAYRTASERMKRERRMYVNGAGDYRLSADEQDAYLSFVEAIEAIIAEEQQIYWPDRSEKTSTGAATDNAVSTPKMERPANNTEASTPS